MPKQKESVELRNLIKAAKDTVNWFYIFGLKNPAAGLHLKKLDIALREYEIPTKI